MFGRSQSGPGGLSINTGSANALSSSQPSSSASKPPASLFGSLSTSQAQSSQPPQASSLFGNLPQPQQSGGLFGSSTLAASNQQKLPSSNTFSENQSGQATGSGLFGQTTNQQQSVGGMFGSNTAQQVLPQQGGGMFASLGQAQAPNPAQQPPASLFGGFSNQNKTASLFGDSQNFAPSQQTTMRPPPPPPASLFSSQIGQQNQQQIVPGVKISINELRGTTRFNDLHEELQKVIEHVDNFIHQQIKIQEDCAGGTDRVNSLSHQMGPDVDYCTKALDTLNHALENDAQSIAFAKNLVKRDAEDARLSFKIVQKLKQPAQFHQSGSWTTSNPQILGLSSLNENMSAGTNTTIVDYFSKQSEAMAKLLDLHKRNIEEVETYLKGIESNTMQQMQQMMSNRNSDGNEKNAEDQVRELAAVLRDFETGINSVAIKVGEAREKTQGVMMGTAENGGTRSKMHSSY